MSKELKPSDFAGIFPWSSVKQNSESEHNMMHMLHIMTTKLNNQWGITYEQYKNAYPETTMSEQYFNELAKYLKSVDTLKLFSKKYEEVN